ncbi:hypothetical protein B9Z55_024485 [Caenorhabditis nigoni]|uniref:Uncharacterized protein n=1 Tax=Caenorhabditis nigoni TaxID=1611254 RepID=A0A2G5SU60_9PELO|nr:hypothetical protein B9Z55_024485 [Caenorhabditis nigoni]
MAKNLPIYTVPLITAHSENVKLSINISFSSPSLQPLLNSKSKVEIYTYRAHTLIAAYFGVLLLNFPRHHYLSQSLFWFALIFEIIVMMHTYIAMRSLKWLNWSATVSTINQFFLFVYLAIVPAILTGDTWPGEACNPSFQVCFIKLGLNTFQTKMLVGIASRIFLAVVAHVETRRFVSLITFIKLASDADREIASKVQEIWDGVEESSL